MRKQVAPSWGREGFVFTKKERNELLVREQVRDGARASPVNPIDTEYDRFLGEGSDSRAVYGRANALDQGLELTREDLLEIRRRRHATPKVGECIPRRSGGRWNADLHRAHAEIEEMGRERRLQPVFTDRDVSRAEGDEEWRIRDLNRLCFDAAGTHTLACRVPQEGRSAIEGDGVANIEQSIRSRATVDGQIMSQARIRCLR